MNVRRQNTLLGSTLIAVVLLIAGIGVLYAGEKIPATYPSWRSLVASIGSLIIASIAVTVIWELFQKRLFRDELLEYFRISENIEQSGVERIIYRFDEVDWGPFFQNCRYLDLYVSYARSWRGQNEMRLRDLANRKDARVRIVLPDPENADLVHQLAIRFRKTNEETARLIQEAIAEFRKLFDGKECNFCLRVTDRPPTNAYYRSDACRIVTLYNYKEEKGDVPVFLLKKPGRLGDFFEDEFEYLVSSGKEPKKS